MSLFCEPMKRQADLQQMTFSFFSSPEQLSQRVIVLPSALAAVLALTSTNVEVFVQVFKTSLFPNLITNLIHLWYDFTYWSKILGSTIPTTLGHVKVKVKVTDLVFMLKFYVKFFRTSLCFLFDWQAWVQVSYPVWGQVLFGFFLAHLSKSSGWAIVITLCPSSGVCRPSSTISLLTL